VLKRKNYPKAIEYLKNAVESLPCGPRERDASFIDSLALAYYKSGDLEKARETYEKTTSKTIPIKRHRVLDRITANELCKQAGLMPKF
jgi:tetratricopeptide (TPR) repeat protein